MYRNGTLDYARLLAAFGIVFFHVEAPGASIGYAALPFFLLLLVVLAFPGAERLSFPDYLRGRIRRLLMPWLIWSAVYGALKLAEICITGAPFKSEFAPNMLFIGTALHLWFLPFAFAACVAVYPLAHFAQRIDPRILALIMASTGWVILMLRQEVTLPVPAAQWLYALPAVCVGTALALVWGRLHPMLLILCGFIGAALLSGAHMGLLQIGLASGALILCMLCPLPATRAAQLAGALSLGVYLAHPLVLSVLNRTTSLPEHSITMAVLGCLGALVIAWSIHKVTGMQRRSHVASAADRAQNTIS